jgi:hypothetical protein
MDRVKGHTYPSLEKKIKWFLFSGRKRMLQYDGSMRQNRFPFKRVALKSML